MRERQGFLKHVVLLIGLLALLSLPSRSTVQHGGATHASLAYAGQYPEKTWYLLHLDLGPAWQTTITLTNLEAQQVQVTLSAYDQGGGFLGKIPAITSLEAEVTQTLEAEKVLSPGSDTLKLESSGKLVGSALFKTLDGKKAEAIPAIQDASQQVDFPPLLQGDQDDKTITLLNTEPTSANLLVIALNQRGVELERTLLPPLLPMVSHTFAVQDLFRSEILQQLATVRVISDRRLVGLQLVNPPYADLVGLPALTATSREWSFPIATQGGDVELWTAVGLFNPGEFSISVTVEAFDAANTSLGIIDGPTLLPGAIHFVITANLRGAIPSNAASLKVTSDQPITGYEVIGVANGTGLTAALGIPEENQALVGFEIVGSNDGDVLNAYPIVRTADGSVKSTAGDVPEGSWKKRVESRALPLSKRLSTAQEGIAAATLGTTASQWQWPRNNPYLACNDYSSYRSDCGTPGDSRRHTGVDVYETPSNIKGPVFAVADGEVVGIFRPTTETVSPCSSNCVRAYTNYSYPHYNTYSRVFNGEIIRDHNMQGVVIIRHSLPAGGGIYNGGTIYSLYAHLSTIPDSLTVGQTISRGNTVGNTGGGGNKHVHLEIKNQPYRHDPLRNWGGYSGRVPYWGYTPDSPNNYGYWDPWIFIHTISSINPTTGSAGTEVTLNGSKFNSLSDATNAKVEFGGARATVVSYSDTQIRVTAPTGSGTVHVRLMPTKYYRYQSLPGGVKNWMSFTYPTGITITIFTNEAAFTPGDTLTLSASITNPGPAIVVDIFTGFLLPDGRLLFIDPSLTLVLADASDSTTYTPIVTSVTLPAGYELPKTPFFSVVLPSTVPPGTYYAFAALAEPGSAKVGAIKLIGDLSVAKFTVARAASPQISLSIEKQYYKIGETLIIDYTTVRGESNNTVDVYVTFEYLDKGYVAYYYYDPSDPDDDWFHRDASPFKTSWNVKDETGRFIEYTFKEETPGGNYQVQAFLTLPGAHPKDVLSKSNTVSYYVKSKNCSAATALGSKTSRSSIKQKASLIEELNLLRRIRDEILAQTPEGKDLIRLYYKHSPEIVWIFLTNPDLRKRSGNLLKQFITISSRESLDKGKIILPSSVLKDIKPLLDDLAKESSLELQSNIDIWDKRLSLLESQGIVEIK